MGAFEDTAPTIAASGLTEVEVLAEVEVEQKQQAPVEPVLKPLDVKRICKYASVYGRELNTIKNATKRAMAEQSIEQFAMSQGLWPEQVRRVMNEWYAFIKTATQIVGGRSDA